MSGVLNAAWVVMICGDLWPVSLALLWVGAFVPLCRLEGVLERRVGLDGRPDLVRGQFANPAGRVGAQVF